jgi:hypothetical protein
MRTIRQLVLASLILGLLLGATCVPVLAAVTAVTSPAINATITNVTDWVRGLLISLGILAFVVGAAFYIFDSTVGGQERGKSFMIAAVGGVMLGLLAGPIVSLAASLVGTG